MNTPETISLYEFLQKIPNEEAARIYFENKRWNGTPVCGHCGSENVVECKDHTPMAYRCKDCRKHFSVRTGTVLAESRLPLHKWLMAIYMMTTARKGIPSTQLARELGITQKSAWFLAQRIRETWMASKDKDTTGKETDKIVEPIDAPFDDVAGKIVQGAPIKHNSINELRHKLSAQGATQEKQLTLDIGIDVERDINGIEMGVLENGIAFLSQRGLQRIIGVTRKKLFDITNDWEESFSSGLWEKSRISFIADRLAASGYMEPKLYVEVMKGGVVHYAYPDIVCMAILEYYAFESQPPSPTALESYRKFAQYGLQKFIYDAIGYRPSDSWKYFHDRTSILKDASPDGHFIVYNEITGLVVDLISSNLPVNDKTVPDISVGITWAKYWKDRALESKYGDRIKYEHNYPDYYPQSASNPQPAWAYPDNALSEFRSWFKHEYLLTKFPAYILNKASALKGGKSEAERIAGIFKPKQIEG